MLPSVFEKRKNYKKEKTIKKKINILLFYFLFHMTT